MSTQPYRQPTNPENNAVKMLKKDVGKITVDFYYRDKDDKVVCRQITYVGKLGGYHSNGSAYFERAQDQYYDLLHVNYRGGSGNGYDYNAYIFDDLVVNQNRMIEMRVLREPFEIEYPEKEHKS